VHESIDAVHVDKRFPSPEATDALKDADLIVACLDRFDARAAVNTFARRYRLPLVDIGMSIRSPASTSPTPTAS
jgi:molybdopterin/thiamine biosynthesis adenylyltransferase